MAKSKYGKSSSFWIATEDQESFTRFARIAKEHETNASALMAKLVRAYLDYLDEHEAVRVADIRRQFKSLSLTSQKQIAAELNSSIKK